VVNSAASASIAAFSVLDFATTCPYDSPRCPILR
jgi:hypothetical protein